MRKIKKKSRTIVIGDIHGCYTELQGLIRKLAITRSDRIILIGDLVAKGPASRKVLEFAQGQHGCETILGNHEYILLEHFRGKRPRLEPAHQRVVEELGDDYERHMKWLAGLPSYIDLGEYAVVHAGVRPGVSLARQTRRDLAFLRTVEGRPESRSGTPWFECYNGKRTIIFGHWVFPLPFTSDRTIGIDTGCVYGGKLTALVLPDRSLVQVNARRVYVRRSR